MVTRSISIVGWINLGPSFFSSFKSKFVVESGMVFKITPHFHSLEKPVVAWKLFKNIFKSAG